MSQRLRCIGVACLAASAMELEAQDVSIQHAAVGRTVACVVTTDRETRCWQWSDVRHQESTFVVRALQVPNLPPLDAIAAGDEHACGLSEGVVWCWGSNRLGQLGRWNRDSVPRPVTLDRARAVTFTSISVGAHHSCALSAEGEAWCWGDQWDGSTGTRHTGETVRFPSPVLSKWRLRALAAGGRQSCALTSEGAPVCWGDNATQGVRSDGWRTYFAPVAVTGYADGTSVATGSGGSCVLRRDQGPSCWGSLGRGATDAGTTEPLRQLVIGDSVACGITGSARTVVCWPIAVGSARRHIVSDGTQPLAAREVATNGDRFCAVTDASRLWCWRGTGQDVGQVLIGR